MDFYYLALTIEFFTKLHFNVKKTGYIPFPVFLPELFIFLLFTNLIKMDENSFITHLRNNLWSITFVVCTRICQFRLYKMSFADFRKNFALLFALKFRCNHLILCSTMLLRMNLPCACASVNLWRALKNSFVSPQEIVLHFALWQLSIVAVSAFFAAKTTRRQAMR